MVDAVSDVELEPVLELVLVLVLVLVLLLVLVLVFEAEDVVEVFVEAAERNCCSETLSGVFESEQAVFIVL